jgi:apolipoprotein D and lipocalin family protein
VLLSACSGTPKDIKVVRGFDLDRYLGTWYEIARLDHRFERGLSNVTASYTLRDDGAVRVVNRGYDDEKGIWKEAEGKAVFVDAKDVGQLKVSFFGPFYGGYNIIDLDPDYDYALVCGPNRSFLWILARGPDLPPAALDRLVEKATRLGFATDNLIYVSHERHRTQAPANPIPVSLNAGDWRTVNDNVMGGRTDSDVIETDDGIRFQGSVSLANNGGFASARRRLNRNLADVQAIQLTVRGDGRSYQLRLREDERSHSVAWRHVFATDGNWQRITLPLLEFEPVFRGRKMANARWPEVFETLGLMTADKRRGRFQLDVAAIGLM